MFVYIPLFLALQAVSHLIPAPGFSGKGEITLTETEGGEVVMEATFEGLNPGRHLLQLHAEGCSAILRKQAAGAHFNPLPVNGCDPSHAILEIGEIEADAKGYATFEATLEGAHLDGQDSIIGYALVVHPVGVSNTLKGAKAAPLACGVIEKTP